MNAITFDTHFHIKPLRKKGFSEQQAESVVEMVKEVREEAGNNLATKADLKSAIHIIRLELQHLESRLTIKMGAMLFALAGFLKYFNLH